MNRSEWRQRAEDRIADAECLLLGGRWSGAYYLAGYAVECGLKACILAHVDAVGAIFLDKKFSEKCWTHDLDALLKLADLETALGFAIAANLALQNNWDTAKEWDEAARYEERTEADARRLFDAITHPTDGVLTWIRTKW